jgi:hypothetical protein
LPPSPNRPWRLLSERKSRCAPAKTSIHERYPAIGKVVDRPDNADLLFVSGLAQYRRGRLDRRDGKDDILPDRVIKVIV